MEQIIITHVSRSVIKGVSAELNISVQGEAFERGWGSPDFLIYPATLVVVEADGSSAALTETQRTDVLEKLIKAMKERHQTIELER